MASVNVNLSLDIDKMIEKAKKLERELVLSLKASSKFVKDEARNRAPVEDPNLVREEDKQLKDSIQTKTKKYKGGQVITAITAPNYDLGFGGREAHLQEFGHIAQDGAAVPGKAWWQPAVDTQKKKARAMHEKNVAGMYKRMSK